VTRWTSAHPPIDPDQNDRDCRRVSLLLWTVLLAPVVVSAVVLAVVIASGWRAA
jgi:hypothetical protein